MQAPKVFRLHVMRVRHFTVLKLNILFEAVELCGQDLISSDNIKNIKDTKRAPILFIWESFPPPPPIPGNSRCWQAGVLSQISDFQPHVHEFFYIVKGFKAVVSISF